MYILCIWCKADKQPEACVSVQELNGGEPLPVLSDDVRTAIMKNITRRMTPQPLKIRADIDMTCFAYDGVLHIQVLLKYTDATHLTPCFALHPQLALGDKS